MIPNSEVKRLKGLGCLRDKRYPNRFNVRVITKNGKITSHEHKHIAEAAERFGNGEITMTTRLTLEIQSIPYENIEPLFAFLKEAGLETGGTGALVRPVVSCKGTTCQYGLHDTFDLSEKLHYKFYKGWREKPLPHKFKIAVGGCPNNCVKPELNDIGIVGQKIPQANLDLCKGCNICQVEKTCPVHAAKLVDGKLSINDEGCIHCGRCSTKCPFKVTENVKQGYKVFIGGRWGKKINIGQALSPIFTSQEEIFDVVESTLSTYLKEGIKGERFAETIERIGFDCIQEKILHKEEIK